MDPQEEPKRPRHRGKHMLIPAGILIGLGAGIIVGHPASGILIGLGLGLFGSALTSFGTQTDAEKECCRHGGKWAMGIVGIFFILIGVAITWAPEIWTYLWPYGVGILFILLGLWFIAKMFWKRE